MKVNVPTQNHSAQPSTRRMMTDIVQASSLVCTPRRNQVGVSANLMGDEALHSTFYGKSCKLCGDSTWIVMRKSIN